MNVEMLERVIEYIAEEPRRLMMEHWYGTAPLTLPVSERPPCNTVMCIGGTTQHLWTQDNNAELRAAPDAEKILDITSEQADRLFFLKGWLGPYKEGWSEKFSNAYIEASTPQERADITIERIRHFIATDGKE